MDATNIELFRTFSWCTEGKGGAETVVWNHFSRWRNMDFQNRNNQTNSTSTNWISAFWTVEKQDFTSVPKNPGNIEKFLRINQEIQSFFELKWSPIGNSLD